MPLLEQIDSDIKDAMRAKAADRLGLLRLLKAATKNAAIEKGGAALTLDDSEVIAVIRKQIKQRQDSVESFLKGDRPELAAREQSEIDWLQAYLPQALSDTEISALIAEAIAESGATSKAQMGLVMKAATAKAAGRIDGRTLSQAVQKALG